MAKKEELIAQYVGREGVYFVPISNKEKRAIEPLCMRVCVCAVRRSFGRLDFQVTPVAGTGKQWLSADSVNLDPETKPSAPARLAAYLKPK